MGQVIATDGTAIAFERQGARSPAVEVGSASASGAAGAIAGPALSAATG
ncbi:hypothetical protein AnaeK_3233 [Anaeromyxobacter sp. K]|nr:hypothetical protein [Anaeromyxobacter sp. K]ACG74454.1 hypothetical protein AnaeK_3233 [Anaeromyxobacter sp. K]